MSLLHSDIWLITALRKLNVILFIIVVYLLESPSYGIDAELKNKRDASLDPKLETEAREWIAAVGGTPIGPDLAASLNDGVLL